MSFYDNSFSHSMPFSNGNGMTDQYQSSTFAQHSTCFNYSTHPRRGSNDFSSAGPHPDYSSYYPSSGTYMNSLNEFDSLNNDSSLFSSFPSYQRSSSLHSMEDPYLDSSYDYHNYPSYLDSLSPTHSISSVDSSFFPPTFNSSYSTWNQPYSTNLSRPLSGHTKSVLNAQAKEYVSKNHSDGVSKKEEVREEEDEEKDVKEEEEVREEMKDEEEEIEEEEMKEEMREEVKEEMKEEMREEVKEEEIKEEMKEEEKEMQEEVPLPTPLPVMKEESNPIQEEVQEEKSSPLQVLPPMNQQPEKKQLNKKEDGKKKKEKVVEKKKKKKEKLLDKKKSSNKRKGEISRISGIPKDESFPSYPSLTDSSTPSSPISSSSTFSPSFNLSFLSSLWTILHTCKNLHFSVNCSSFVVNRCSHLQRRYCSLHQYLLCSHLFMCILFLLSSYSIEFKCSLENSFSCCSFIHLLFPSSFIFFLTLCWSCLLNVRLVNLFKFFCWNEGTCVLFDFYLVFMNRFIL